MGIRKYIADHAGPCAPASPIRRNTERSRRSRVRPAQQGGPTAPAHHHPSQACHKRATGHRLVGGQGGVPAKVAHIDTTERTARIARCTSTGKALYHLPEHSPRGPGGDRRVDIKPGKTCAAQTSRGHVVHG